MKDSKGPTTQATMFLKAHGVAFTDHLYAYEEHGGTSVSARELGVDEHAVVKRSSWKMSSRNSSSF